LLCVLLQIYRNFEFGKLMKLIMLDTRIIGEKCALCARTSRLVDCCLFFELQLIDGTSDSQRICHAR
jgi:hypothetical protein